MVVSSVLAGIIEAKTAAKEMIVSGFVIVSTNVEV
jgi:hypothetical protein